MVAAADISLQDVTNQVISINIMDAETGYAFLVDTATGMILAHPDTSYNASKISAQGADSFLGQISTKLGADKFKRRHSAVFCNSTGSRRHNMEAGNVRIAE